MNEPCDLCAEIGITRDATSETPIGRTWTFVCASHAYRARSAGRSVIDLPAAGADHLTCGGEGMMPLERDPQPSEVPC